MANASGFDRNADYYSTEEARVYFDGDIEQSFTVMPGLTINVEFETETSEAVDDNGNSYDVAVKDRKRTYTAEFSIYEDYELVDQLTLGGSYATASDGTITWTDDGTARPYKDITFVYNRDDSRMITWTFPRARVTDVSMGREGAAKMMTITMQNFVNPGDTANTQVTKKYV